MYCIFSQDLSEDGIFLNFLSLPKRIVGSCLISMEDNG